MLMLVGIAQAIAALLIAFKYRMGFLVGAVASLVGSIVAPIELAIMFATFLVINTIGWIRWGVDE